MNIDKQVSFHISIVHSVFMLPANVIRDMRASKAFDHFLDSVKRAKELITPHAYELLSEIKASLTGRLSKIKQGFGLTPETEAKILNTLYSMGSLLREKVKSGMKSAESYADDFEYALTKFEEKELPALVEDVKEVGSTILKDAPGVAKKLKTSAFETLEKVKDCAKEKLHLIHKKKEQLSSMIIPQDPNIIRPGGESEETSF